MLVYKQAEYDGLCGFYAVLNAFLHLDSKTGDKFDIPLKPREYFDEMVETLARLGGISIRILKSDSNDGGLDRNYIHALCYRYAKEKGLPVKVSFCTGEPVSFEQRYRSLWHTGLPFCFIALEKDGGHWVTVGRRSAEAYDLLNEGKSKRVALSDDPHGLQGMNGVILTLRRSDVTGQDN